MVVRWDKSSVIRESLKYDSKKSFEQGGRGAYKFALKHGFIDELFSNKLTYWDKRSVTDEAKKYTSKVAFQRGNGSAYAHARINGFIDELFTNNRQPRLTKELVVKLAKNCISKQDFRCRYNSEYQYAKRHGFIGELFLNVNNYWCTETVAIEAKKYTSKKDFMRKSGGAYDYARLNGYLDSLFPVNHFGHNTRDCVYIWSIDDSFTVYKVGVTSENLGIERIESVARQAGFGTSFSVVMLKKVGFVNAKILEAAIKRLGKRHVFSRRFSGSTEFREFSASDIDHAMKLVVNSCSTADQSATG